VDRTERVEGCHHSCLQAGMAHIAAAAAAASSVALSVMRRRGGPAAATLCHHGNHTCDIALAHGVTAGATRRLCEWTSGPHQHSSVQISNNNKE